MKKVFNNSELHFSEETSYKIHTLLAQQDCLKRKSNRSSLIHVDFMPLWWAFCSMYYVLASWTKLFFVYFLFSPKSKIIQPCSMCVKMKIAVQVTAGHDSVPFLGSLGNAFSAIPCFEQSYTSQVDTCLAL